MPCPFCKDLAALQPDTKNNVHLKCLGNFSIPSYLYNNLDSYIKKIANNYNTISVETVRCFLKYKIANEIEFHNKKFFEQKDIDRILSNIEPLNSAQRINNLILYIGKKTETPGVPLCNSFQKPEDSAVLSQVSAIGCFIDWQAMLNTMKDSDFKHFFNIGQGHLNISLTNKGWEKFQDLQKFKDGRRVFVAMSFGDKNTSEQRKSFFELSIKKPLQEIGFSAERVDTKTRVGLIDLQIIQDIAQSSLVIADISDNNLGVYWEAGYAEGIGRPVLYIRDGNKEKPHFDVQHRQRIDFSSPEELKEQLKKFVNDNFKKELI